MMSDLILKTAQYVKSVQETEGSGHDWYHTWRVRDMALEISAIEGGDPEIIELAALLHDLADWKFRDGDEHAGCREAKDWLISLQAPNDVIDRVVTTISQVSFKGAGVATPASTLEAAIVQDADRLDALGAIGIARAFAYGGFRQRVIFDPQEPTILHQDFTEYKSSKSSSIAHFYEKLLLLKDRMQTRSGRKVAEQRHRFMELFLEEFFAECHENPPD